LETPDEKLSHYNKIDDKGRKYYLKPLRAMGGQGDSREARPSLYFPITAPDGTEVYPKKQDGSDGAWRWKKSKVEDEKHRIEWIRTKNGWSANTRLYLDNNTGRPPETIWFHPEVGSNRTSKSEIKNLMLGEKSFDTPKPERLIERVIHIASDKGDVILDSFLGSGTTAAVANKMGRKWIGIELGEHATTHCYPRLKAVVDGEQGGISQAVNWEGGGGFKFYTLAPSLLNKDQYGNWIISKEYNAQMLAAAMAKQEGFRYEPDSHLYWKQGRSTEKDFIFTTTQFVTVEMLDKIHAEMQPEESLLIACKSFQKECKHRHANISIKKIPHMLMGRCEFNKDDYSFNIVNMPVEERDTEESTPAETEATYIPVAKPSKKSPSSNQPSLF
jgi:adenine-specific DNA-methyltransferase